MESTFALPLPPSQTALPHHITPMPPPMHHCLPRGAVFRKVIREGEEGEGEQHGEEERAGAFRDPCRRVAERPRA